MATIRGLLVDYGGVLTTSVFGSFAAFCAAEGLAPERMRDAFRSDPRSRELLIELETGRLGERGFEAGLGDVLGLEPTGLIDRLFAGMAPEPTMVEAVAAAHAAGVRTGLLSNSWGEATRYDTPTLQRLFDAQVISSREGVRKPEPAIYELAVQRLGLPPAQVAFVDDLPFNLKPARELGITTVHHVDPEQTIAELEALLGVPLR